MPISRRKAQATAPKPLSCLSALRLITSSLPQILLLRGAHPVAG
jgi:hypothetical protein